MLAFAAKFIKIQYRMVIALESKSSRDSFNLSIISALFMQTKLQPSMFYVLSSTWSWLMNWEHITLIWRPKFSAFNNWIAPNEHRRVTGTNFPNNITFQCPQCRLNLHNLISAKAVHKEKTKMYVVWKYHSPPQSFYRQQTNFSFKQGDSNVP